MNRLPLRTRIAPTPSGYLHMGNLFSFVLTWLIAKSRGGTVRLRIDDLDAARMRTAYLEDIFSTLDFIGLVPDEGPSGVNDFLRNHSQLQRLEQYNALVMQLKEAGHLYACSCSRSQVIAENPGGIYSGTCRNKSLDFGMKDVAWRLRLPEQSVIRFGDVISGKEYMIPLAGSMGDFVVRRKDRIPAYQVASLSDDLFYGINLVVRGEDLLPSTAAQMLLAGMAGIPSFRGIEWHHHALIKNEKGLKLSKSAGDSSIAMMRTKGLKRADIYSEMALHLGLKQQPVFTFENLLETWGNRKE